MKYRILLLSLLLNTLLIKVFAVSAFPYPITIKQADSTEITIRQVGDEFFHYTQTTDGLLIQRNDKDIFEYADLSSDGTLVLTGIKANDITKRKNIEIEFVKSLREKKVKEKWLENQHKKSKIQTEKSLSQMTMLGTNSPITGTKKVLCILIGTPDRMFTKTQSSFYNLMNQTAYNGTGSVKDFYKENSYNQLNLDITVVGPYTADNNMAYYGANIYNSEGNRIGDSNPQALINEAIQKANPDVNYADFDNDGDGKVDGVHVIFAGYDEAASSYVNTIWSHRWSISGVTLDGKLITDYSCSSELRGYTGNNICGIGTACHEMGHVFGASDFYDTNRNDYGDGEFIGTGSWDLMAGGNWNGSSDKPAHFNPYIKTQTFQWATVQNITSNQQITLYPANSSPNSFYRINSFTPNEYFLIENRQKLGFDVGLPGDGMLVYHVHSLFNGSSQINNITHPQRFYPICASATQNPNSNPTSYGDINNSGCPFPGSSNKTSLTHQSTPSLISWSGEGTGFDIQSISKFGNNIQIYIKTYFSISGTSNICNQSTYTINNLPQGSTVNWIGSRALSIVSGQGTNSVVCQKTMFAITGSTLILRAIITFPTGQTMELTKNIFVGTYPPAILLCPATDIPPFAPHVEFGYTNENYYLFAHGENMSNNASDYLWRFYPLNTFELPQQSTGRYVAYSKSTPGEYKVSVQYNGECGWSPEVFRNIRFEDNLNVNLYPNPTSDILTAELTSNQAKSSVNSLTSNTNFDPYTIQLWNEYQGHVCSFEIIESKQQLSLQGLPSGMYIALIIKDGKTHQRKIVWKN